MIACCGLDCSKCEAYLATREDNDVKRAEVAKKWSVQYNTAIKPEHINCDGCRTGEKLFFYSSDMCEIRKCCMEKEIENRAACEMYICDKLKAFIALAPEAGSALEKLHMSAAWPRASSLIVEETLALCFTRRGGVYPRPKTTAITATGGDKPRPYFISM
jgi:hypothetical protein